MNPSILVTGATGTVGSRVVARLREMGIRPRVLVRDPDRVPDDWAGVDVAVGDFTDTTSLDDALRGVDRMFLTSADGPDKVAHETAAVDAVARAGVERVVKLSALHARTGSPVPAFDWHGQIEERLADSGIAHTDLRPAFFMENLLMMAAGIAATGQLHAPTSDGRLAMIAADDVAASAVAALTSADPPLPVYDLTGPSAITFAEVATAIADATGRPVTFVDLTPEQAAAHFAGGGLPEWLGRQLGGVFALARAGGFSEVTDSVPILAGRPAVPFARWAELHATAFAGGSPPAG